MGGWTQIYEEALNAGVVLDLPAYDALLQALVADARVADAAALLKAVVERKDVGPTETTYAPLLLALMRLFEYEEVVELIDHGRSHGISFTLDVRACVRPCTCIVGIWERRGLTTESGCR